MKFTAIVVSTITAGLVSCLLLLAGSAGMFTKWQPLKPLPDKPIRILGADFNSLFVVTSGNEVYKCIQFVKDANCWSRSAWPQELPVDPHLSDCAHYQFYAPGLPGHLVDQIEVRNCAVEFTRVLNYAVLEDGSVWEWRHSTYGPAIIVYTGLGAAGGFIVGLLIAVGLHFWQTRNRSEIAMAPSKV